MKYLLILTLLLCSGCAAIGQSMAAAGQGLSDASRNQPIYQNQWHNTSCTTYGNQTNCSGN